MEKGKEAGIEIGMEKGIKEGKLAMARNLLQLGILPAEEIARLAGLELADIQLLGTSP